MVAGDGTLRTRYHGDRGEPVAVDAGAALAGAAALLIDGSAARRSAARRRAARKRSKLPVIFDVGELREGTERADRASPTS